MTQFIELTGFDAQDNPKKFDINISSISTIEESEINDKNLIYAIGRSFYIKESRQQIKALIQEAQNPQPYQTK